MNGSQRLQRLAVRMLYDEGFRARVLDGGEAIDEADRAHLAAVDRRAWSTDPYRAGRTLSAILSELPVTGALLGAARALTFFRSPEFHTAIEGRGSLVLSFGQWADVGPIGALELEIARLRRAHDPEPGRGSMAPGPFRPVAVPAGTLAAYEGLRQGLGPDPLAAIAAAPRVAPPLGDGREHLSIERVADGSIAIGTLGEALYEVLASLLSGPRASEALRAHFRSLGADEPDEILGGLVADGVLVTAP